MATARPAWTNTWSRSPRRIATIPAEPTEEHVGAISSELPLTAPRDDRDDRHQRRVATPASSRIARSMPAAAVGTMNGSPGRPAVSFSASVATTSDQADAAAARCCGARARAGTARPRPSSRPTSRSERSTQPPSRATSQRGTSRPKASIFSSCLGGDPVALAGRSLALLTVDERGGTACRGARSGPARSGPG